MTMDVELLIRPTPEESAHAAAELLCEAVRREADIALSGGSTPRAAYERAAEVEPDWTRSGLWLADERVVPLDDPRSNARLVQETLLEQLSARPQTHFVRTELEPSEAAAKYDHALRGVRLELVLLGIGRDGHTASLFPHAPTLDERERLAIAAEPGLEPFVPRVTMTIPALSAAAHVVFLVTGPDKAEAVKRAFGELASPATPASLVRSHEGRTTVILDAAAASALRQ
jgi:6-phosphogluconolactonase